MKYNNGFTLVELLVVIAVAGLLLTVVLSLLLSGFENFNLGTDRAESQNDVRLVENIVHNELRNARSIKVGDDLRDYEDDGASWEDCPGNEYTMKLINGAFIHKGRKVTGEIFKEISFKVINKNIFELKLEFKNENKDPYKIKILINNFTFDNSYIGDTKKLSNYDSLVYKKE